MYPSLQRHSNFPGMFTHCSFSAHGFWVHSSTSEKYVCYIADSTTDNRPLTIKIWRWQEIAVFVILPNQKFYKWQCILASSHLLSYPFPLDNTEKKKDHMGWTRDLCILNNFSNPILTSTRSHLLFFKARELCSSLLQPKGYWVHLSSQFSSSCWNPLSSYTIYSVSRVKWRHNHKMIVRIARWYEKTVWMKLSTNTFTSPFLVVSINDVASLLAGAHVRSIFLF